MAGAFRSRSFKFSCDRGRELANVGSSHRGRFFWARVDVHRPRAIVRHRCSACDSWVAGYRNTHADIRGLWQESSGINAQHKCAHEPCCAASNIGLHGNVRQWQFESTYPRPFSGTGITQKRCHLHCTSSIARLSALLSCRIAQMCALPILE